MALVRIALRVFALQVLLVAGLDTPTNLVASIYKDNRESLIRLIWSPSRNANSQLVQMYELTIKSDRQAYEPRLVDATHALLPLGTPGNYEFQIRAVEGTQKSTPALERLTLPRAVQRNAVDVVTTRTSRTGKPIFSWNAPAGEAGKIREYQLIYAWRSGGKVKNWKIDRISPTMTQHKVPMKVQRGKALSFFLLTHFNDGRSPSSSAQMVYEV